MKAKTVDHETPLLKKNMEQKKWRWEEMFNQTMAKFPFTSKITHTHTHAYIYVYMFIFNWQDPVQNGNECSMFKN